ncbi:MAG: alpha/beta hydrolase-fold protein [Rhodothermales bacterium]
MHREHIKWHSPALGRDMDLLVLGHAGTPALVFPSSLGRFYEWEDFGMAGALSRQLEEGHNRLICVDSVDAESLYNRGVDPYTRIKRHQQYERYIIDEVVPYIRHISGQSFLIAAGASFGGYHAANMVFKHPWAFGKLIALSGAFDIRSQLDGFYNDDVYFSNPIDYLPNLTDHGTLEAIRRNHIILSTAEYDPCKAANDTLSGILHAKSIGHTLDSRPGVFGHDWPWWRDLIVQHIA